MKIMVLNDGETFTDIGNCLIVEVPDHYTTEEMEEELDKFSFAHGPLSYKDLNDGVRPVAYFDAYGRLVIK